MHLSIYVVWGIIWKTFVLHQYICSPSSRDDAEQVLREILVKYGQNTDVNDSPLIHRGIHQKDDDFADRDNLYHYANEEEHLPPSTDEDEETSSNAAEQRNVHELITILRRLSENKSVNDNTNDNYNDDNNNEIQDENYGYDSDGKNVNDTGSNLDETDNVIDVYDNDSEGYSDHDIGYDQNGYTGNENIDNDSEEENVDENGNSDDDENNFERKDKNNDEIIEYNGESEVNDNYENKNVDDNDNENLENENRDISDNDNENVGYNDEEKVDDIIAGHGGNAIDTRSKNKLDPNSDLFYLLDSMQVEHSDLDGPRGVKHKPSGIQKLAEQSSKHYSENHDFHKHVPIGDSGSQKRNFKLGSNLWPGGIVPYTIGRGLTDGKSRSVIEEAVKQFSDLTCVKWVQRDSAEAQSVGHKDYVNFFSDSGCWSYVGRINRGKQDISLQSPYCVSRATTVHEMCHAIGQEHEQSRNDRDDHITLKWDNIRGGRNNVNMQKENTADNNPYDYESVLQYGLRSFAIDRSKPSLVFHDRNLDFLADSAKGLTFYDVQDILDTYNCTDHCRTKPSCKNGGVVNHKCKCYCPPGLTGNLCQSTMSNSVCGTDIIDLKLGESKNITTPHYPNNYPLNTTCIWLIKAPQKNHIKMTINSLRLNDNGNSCYHWLEIQYNLIGQTGVRLCGYLNNEHYSTSKEGFPNLMMLKFDSKFSADRAAKTGFHLTVEAIDEVCVSDPCQYGKCSRNAAGGYLCTCQTGWSGTKCDTPLASTTFTCSFEEGTKCIFNNMKDDQFDWAVIKGPTKSSETGPNSAQSGTYYIYAETSSPRAPGDVTRMETSINFPRVARCLTFWYSMKGADISKLKVYTRSTSTPKMLWTKEGPQPNTWSVASIDIAAADNLKVGFEATRGKGYRGDIAIDSIELRPGKCSQGQTSTTKPINKTTQQSKTTTLRSPTTRSPTTPKPPAPPTIKTPSPTTPKPKTPAPTTIKTPSPTTPKPKTQAPTTVVPTIPISPKANTSVYTCTFEPNDNCFLRNVKGAEDDFDWTVKKGSTPSRLTGPTKAFQGAFYTYIETSSPRQKGDYALLWSDPIPSYSDMCLQFYYYMYGKTMGTLSVLIDDVDNTLGPYEIWSSIGDMGKMWMPESLLIPANLGTNSIQIYFKGVRGDSYTGDIALDYVQLLPGACQSDMVTTLPNTTVKPVSIPAFCDLEKSDTCFVKDITGDDFDWTRRKGKTPSIITGPSKAIQGNYYTYIETSKPRQKGEEAILESADLPSGQDMCLSFNYHMYGQSTGTLEVIRTLGQGQSTSLWKKKGNVGNIWKSATVYLQSDILTSKIQFRGEVGPSYQGDIALDDIKLVPGKCAVNTMSVPAFCNFEPAESCFLVEVDSDDFDWTLKKGRTRSSLTGPSRAGQGQYYKYIETSKPRRQGQEAVLQSEYLPPGQDMCLSFRYHMYGSTIGTLEVSRSTGQGQIPHWNVLWNKSGEIGNAWQTATVSIPSDLNTSKIQFRGEVGSSYTGDIALDDVKILPVPCT